MGITQEEYYTQLAKIALDAAKERAKFNAKMNDSAYSKDDEDKLYQAYARKLENKYPWSPSDEFYDRFSKLQNTSASDLSNWMMGGGELNTFNEKYNPENLAKKAELEKFMPLVAGVAKEGEDWLSTDGSVLRDLAAQEYGYKRKDFPQFLDKLREYQTQFDRAKLVDEMHDQPASFLTSLVYPSLYEGIENSVATGDDLSKGDAVKLGALDAVTNGALWMLPSARLNSLRFHPTWQTALNAVAQGATESARQGVKTAIDDDLEFNSAAPLAALAAGMTRPAMYKTAQTVGAGLEGKEARDFMRGFSQASRSDLAIDSELADLIRSARNYNKNVAKHAGDNSIAAVMQKYYSDYTKFKPVFIDALSKFGQLKDGEKLLNKLEAIGVKPENLQKSAVYRLSDGVTELQPPKRHSVALIDLDKLQSEYEKPLDIVFNTSYNPFKVSVASTKNSGLGRAVILDDNGKAILGKSLKELYDKSYNSRVLDENTANVFQQLFPAKYAEEMGKTGYQRAGYALGKFASDLGSRFEPTFKVNPLNLSDPKEDAYKEQSWYKKLEDSENGQVLRKLIEEALKDKKKK